MGKGSRPACSEGLLKRIFGKRGSRCIFLHWLFVLPFLMGGCAFAGEPGTGDYCRIVMEDHNFCTADSPVLSLERGADAVFVLHPAEGYRVTGTDYPEYVLEDGAEGSQILRLSKVKYSAVVTPKVEAYAGEICYDPNGGSGEAFSEWDMGRHLRTNTARFTDAFQRDGYTLTGWNTKPEGTGTAVGLGSRIDLQGRRKITLYARWCPWTDPESFIWEESGAYAAITGFIGSVENGVLCLPEKLGGRTVIAVENGAFEAVKCESVVLPPTLLRLEDGSFRGCSFQSLTVFDSISSIGDRAFEDCDGFTTLHINAAEEPVYCGSYYSTFADKYDRLLSLKEEKKLVLFSGSSTRFGYDSAALDAGLPEYEVVNMGVFAYTNALPQLLLILPCMQEGDLLLHAPEFDAAQRQFCTVNAMDEAFFCMMEENYDMVAALNMQEFSQVFTALASYLSTKKGMEAKSYGISAADFDENQNPVREPSYNEYGDYILYRPNAAEDTPVYGLPVEYRAEAFPEESFIGSLNRVYERFLEKNCRVCFTYAPRNGQAISQDSTAEERKKLDEYFREKLVVPVISDLEESLYPGMYLYGTDNHLSTEGVQIRTERILRDLWEQEEGTVRIKS